MILNPGEGIDKFNAILWRGILLTGHEACRMFYENSQWHLEGTSVLSYERQPCLLTYAIICDNTWHTLIATVIGWLGKMNVNIQIRSDPSHKWWLNDVEVREVEGCLDVDLNFSPSTNLIPIRRLNLKVGERANLTAAWLRFPIFSLEPLPQSYERLEDSLYRYESGDGRFVADLRVNPEGFVLDYPGIWQADAAS
jgi:hypothetical protein